MPDIPGGGSANGILARRANVSWRDERIGVQIERALYGTRITQGCDFELLVSSGVVLLAGRFVRLSDVDAVLEAIAPIPGLRDIQLDVSVFELIVFSERQSHKAARYWRNGWSGVDESSN